VLVAIETATDIGSVALGRSTELVGEVTIGVRTRHAESVLPALEFLLRSARLERAAIRGIVVGAGPGSFTGVRVAAATARGLAAGLGVPLYAYSSLAALALQAPAGRPVCALFDARRGEVYAACYESEPGSDALRAVLEPAVLSVESVVQRLAGVDPLYVGAGAERYAAELGISRPRPLVPRASALLRLAAADAAAGGDGRVAELAGWEPAYLRASGAERGVAG
jgi:tRNA threonylcarbamoyladenosine biosynthesis protein TsaB